MPKSEPARSRRTNWVLRLPRPLLEMPLEVFVAVFGLFAAILLGFGLVVPVSVATVVPAILVKLWALGLALSAITTAVGIKRNHRRYLPSGLRLFSLMLVVYVIAIVGLAGWGGLATIAFLGPLVPVTALRSLFFRASNDLVAEARREISERHS